MPYDTLKIRGKLRTVLRGQDTPAINTQTGNPIDGGKGWPDTPKGRGKARRQVQHLEDSEAKDSRRHHGRIS